MVQAEAGRWEIKGTVSYVAGSWLTWAPPREKGEIERKYEKDSQGFLRYKKNYQESIIKSISSTLKPSVH